MAEQELKACGSCGLPTTEEDSYRSGPNGEREHFTDAASYCEVRQYQAKISSFITRLSSAEAEVERLRKRNGELVALLGVTSKHLTSDERAREQQRLDARSCRCLCCWRDVCEDDYPEGTGCKNMCNECFREWYDGDRPEAGADAGNTAACIGGWIRKKHGLPPLTNEELESAAARRQQGGTDAR